MELGAEVRKPFQPGAEILRDDPGLQRAQPHPHFRHGPADGFNQVGEGRLPGKIRAPAGNFDTGEDKLPVALPGEGLRLLHRQLQGGGADGAPGVGDDAVGAEVDAAVLNLQKRSGAAFQSAGGEDLKGAALQGVVQGLPVALALQSGGQILDELLPSAAAPKHVNIQLPGSVRVMLGVAAAHADDRFRVLPAAAADDGPVLLVRHGGDGTGVDYVGVTAFVKGADGIAPFPEKLLHGLCFILVGFTAQRIKCDSHLSIPPKCPCFICKTRPIRPLHFYEKLL